MEFKEDIQKRRTTFQFTGTPVTAEQIKWIIRAGITAPSFDHKRKWNLIAVTSEMAKRKVTDYIDPLPCKDTPPENPVQEMIQIAFPKQKSMCGSWMCPSAAVSEHGNSGKTSWCVTIQLLRAHARAGLPGTKDRQQDGRTQGAVHPLGDEHTGGGKSGTEVEPTSLCPTRSSCWV